MSELRIKQKKSFLPIEALQARKPSKKEIVALAREEAEYLISVHNPLEVWIAASQMQDYLSEINEWVKPKAIEQALASLPEKGKTIEIANIKVTVAGGLQKEVYDFSSSEDWRNLNALLQEEEKKVKEIKARIKALETVLALELPATIAPDKPYLKLNY